MTRIASTMELELVESAWTLDFAPAERKIFVMMLTGQFLVQKTNLPSAALQPADASKTFLE